MDEVYISGALTAIADGARARVFYELLAEIVNDCGLRPYLPHQATDPVAAPDLELATWTETADPYALVASLVTQPGALALADQMWAAFALRLQEKLAGRAFRVASDITRELRMRKDRRFSTYSLAGVSSE